MLGSIFSAHSPQTQVGASLFAGILILAAAIFILIASLVCYALIRYRARAGAAEPRQTFGSKGLETVWTAIPLVLVTAIFIVSVRAMALIDAPDQPGRPPDLVITGHQWWWQARYPNGAATAGEIHIPVARRLLVEIESADVIHDFWVPQLARKMDAVPGRSGYIWLEADVAGTYDGKCAEFCGTQHAWMHFIVVAEPEAAFSAWLNHQSEPAPAPASESAAAGASLFQQKKCGDCHAISGTAARGASGPDLTHVASRQYLGAGISPNSADNLARWSASPQGIKPGNRMPDQSLSTDERAAIAAYLETLQWNWIAGIGHKRIGVLYMLSALFFFLVGGMEAMVMRAQLALPNLKLVTPQTYNQIFTMHGTTMIFLVVMPVLTGFGVYLTPLMIGARDTAFPRLTAFSFWLQVCGGLLLYLSFAAGGAPDAGWFSYAPLTEKTYSTGTGLDYWALAILLLGASFIASAITFIVTIATMRAPGMTIRRLPLFIWMNFVTALMILFALPSLVASLVMLLGDRLLHARFFDAAQGGSPLLWQHYFWIFGHPEVYIMILPAFGMISEIIPVFSRKPIFGYRFMALSTVAIAFLSYGVWVHHMFAVALGRTFLSVFAAASMLIAVPTGVKVFSWTATLFGGSIRFTTSMLFAVAFLLEFTIGGLSGVAFAAVPIDWQMTDTYFVVAHLHYVLFGGTVFALFAGVYYWFPKFTGHLLDETMGRWHFWLVVVGFNATFFVQHFLGLIGMPRRVYTYPDLPGWGALNLVSTIGAGILVFGILVFCGNILISFKFGAPAGNDPWNAWTLEWAAASPPAPGNFEEVPPVKSRRPLWDLKHPDAPDWVHEEVEA